MSETALARPLRQAAVPGLPQRYLPQLAVMHRAGVPLADVRIGVFRSSALRQRIKGTFFASAADQAPAVMLVLGKSGRSERRRRKQRGNDQQTHVVLPWIMLKTIRNSPGGRKFHSAAILGTSENALGSVSTAKGKIIGHGVFGVPLNGARCFRLDNALEAPDVPLEHDPEKWTPVFRKDHAPTKAYRAQSIQPEAITL